MVADWFRRGWLVGHPRRPGTPLWVRLTEAERRRWDGSVGPAPDMVPVRQAPEALGMTAEQMGEEIRAGRLLTYRLFIKNRWRWYVRSPPGR